MSDAEKFICKHDSSYSISVAPPVRGWPWPEVMIEIDMKTDAHSGDLANSWVVLTPDDARALAEEIVEAADAAEATHQP